MKEKSIQLELELEYDIDEMIKEQEENGDIDTEEQKPFDEDLVQSI